jgi:hypothetical protein
MRSDLSPALSILTDGEGAKALKKVCAYSLCVVKYGIIRETDNVVSFSAQDPFAKRITSCYFFDKMNVTVYFDNEFRFRTIEVWNEA